MLTSLNAYLKIFLAVSVTFSSIAQANPNAGEIEQQIKKIAKDKAQIEIKIEAAELAYITKLSKEQGEESAIDLAPVDTYMRMALYTIAVGLAAGAVGGVIDKVNPATINDELYNSVITSRHNVRYVIAQIRMDLLHFTSRPELTIRSEQGYHAMENTWLKMNSLTKYLKNYEYSIRKLAGTGLVEKKVQEEVLSNLSKAQAALQAATQIDVKVASHTVAETRKILETLIEQKISIGKSYSRISPAVRSSYKIFSRVKGAGAGTASLGLGVAALVFMGYFGFGGGAFLQCEECKVYGEFEKLSTNDLKNQLEQLVSQYMNLEKQTLNLEIQKYKQELETK